MSSWNKKWNHIQTPYLEEVDSLPVPKVGAIAWKGENGSWRGKKQTFMTKKTRLCSSRRLATASPSRNIPFDGKVTLLPFSDWGNCHLYLDKGCHLYQESKSFCTKRQCIPLSSFSFLLLFSERFWKKNQNAKNNATN